MIGLFFYKDPVGKRNRNWTTWLCLHQSRNNDCTVQLGMQLHFGYVIIPLHVWILRFLGLEDFIGPGLSMPDRRMSSEWTVVSDFSFSRGSRRWRVELGGLRTLPLGLKKTREWGAFHLPEGSVTCHFSGSWLARVCLNSRYYVNK